MHSDGDIKTLTSDLLRLPIQVLNIQDRVNGLDWIAQNLKGRVALDLDIDRQHITPTGTPTEIREYLREVLKKLYDPAGGLILTFGLYPGTPIENVKMLMDVLEHIAEGQTSWSI
jgi:uroporphyrinogen-III decarboxylase